MVIKYSGEDHFKSTYSSFYTREPPGNQIPIKLRHQPTQLLLPVIKHGDKQLVECRTHADYIDKKKYARPIGLSHDNPLCLGLGSFTDAPLQSAHKEIVSCPRPQERKVKRLKKKDGNPTSSEVILAKDALRQGEHLDDMIIRLRWIPSTRRQNEEGCLQVPKWKIPKTTVEQNADVVRNRPKRYESTVGVWKTVASSWDRLQTRRPTFQPKCDKEYTSGKPKTSADFNKEKTELQNFESYREESPYVIADQSRVRTLPGYGGFVPREPVERLKEPQRHEMFQTSSNTYKDFPGYSVEGLHSKGPLSRMVTLVYPCNPFKLTPSTMLTRINPIY